MVNPGEKIRVAIVDDHLSTLNAYRSFLKGYPDLELAGLASSAKELLQNLGEWKPYVVLVDLKLAGEESGVEVIKELAEREPSVKALMLTSYREDEEVVLEGLRVGAYGYLSKAGEPEAIILAIRQAYHNHPILTNFQLERLLKHYQGTAQEVSRNFSEYECERCLALDRALERLNFNSASASAEVEVGVEVESKKTEVSSRKGGGMLGWFGLGRRASPSEGEH